jgi:hypothetical protein
MTVIRFAKPSRACWTSVRARTLSLSSKFGATLRARHYASFAADGVTYDPTGPSIEDRSQVHKAGRDCDIGDVGYPQLVRAIQFHVLREIGEDRIIVIAIRRRDKTPPRTGSPRQ